MVAAVPSPPLDRAARLLRVRDVYAGPFWLHPTGDAVILEGADAGISFRTQHDEATGVTHTVLSNTTAGAWPVTRCLSKLLAS